MVHPWAPTSRSRVCWGFAPSQCNMSGLCQTMGRSRRPSSRQYQQGLACSNKSKRNPVVLLSGRCQRMCLEKSQTKRATQASTGMSMTQNKGPHQMCGVLVPLFKPGSKRTRFAHTHTPPNWATTGLTWPVSLMIRISRSPELATSCLLAQEQTTGLLWLGAAGRRTGGRPQNPKGRQIVGHSPASKISQFFCCSCCQREHGLCNHRFVAI